MASLLLQSSTNVDEVIGDHAEPNPALHADLASVTATVEPVPSLDHTDASFASGAPLLAIARGAPMLVVTRPDRHADCRSGPSPILALERPWPLMIRAIAGPPSHVRDGHTPPIIVRRCGSVSTDLILDQTQRCARGRVPRCGAQA